MRFEGTLIQWSDDRGFGFIDEARAWPAAAPQTQRAFRCDGRTRCSQMTSCAEATWMSNHCPAMQVDGNHDGVPCEWQWCTATH